MASKKRTESIALLPRTTQLKLRKTHGLRFGEASFMSGEIQFEGGIPDSLSTALTDWLAENTNGDVFVGLDLSLSATGVCLMFGDLVFTGRIVAGERAVSPISGKPLQRMAYIKSDVDRVIYTAMTISSLMSFVRRHTESIVIAVEGFSMGSRSPSMDRINYLGWRVREELNEFTDTKKLLVPPTTLKMASTGNGSSNKEKMVASGAEHHNISIQEIRENFPIQACNKKVTDSLGGSDEVDAFYLALLAKHQDTIKVPKVKAYKEF
jgi:hypothetical protein